MILKYLKYWIKLTKYKETTDLRIKLSIQSLLFFFFKRIGQKTVFQKINVHTRITQFYYSRTKDLPNIIIIPLIKKTNRCHQAWKDFFTLWKSAEDQSRSKVYSLKLNAVASVGQ